MTLIDKPPTIPPEDDVLFGDDYEDDWWVHSANITALADWLCDNGADARKIFNVFEHPEQFNEEWKWMLSDFSSKIDKWENWLEGQDG